MIKINFWEGLGRIFKSSPVLYRGYLFYCRIRGIAAESSRKSPESPAIKKEAGMKNFREMLSGMDQEEAAIYGREIIEGYSDDPEKSILLVSHDMSISGAPIVLLYMGQTLKKMGYQVIVIAPPGEEGSVSDALEKEIPVVIHKRLLETDLVRRLAGLFSVIVCNTVVTIPIITMLRNENHRVIWWIHEGVSCYSRKRARIWPEELPDNIRVYTAGAYARKALMARYPGYKVENLIYYSPDVSTMVPPDGKRLNRSHRNNSRKVYALIGGMGYRKGPDILAEAIRLLPEAVLRSCTFIFAGLLSDERIAALLMNLKKDYPDQIVVTGEIPLNEVYQLYPDIDYVVCASRDDPMPVVIAEAMSMGIPSICSKHTGSAAIIRTYKSGYVYAPNSPWKLKAEIMKTFHLPEAEYESLSRNARYAYKHEFSEAVFERRIKEVIDFEC